MLPPVGIRACGFITISGGFGRSYQGVELYGEIANLTHAGAYKDQGHSIGPVVAGAYRLAPFGKIKYEVGYQWGLTNETAPGAARWKFEYEIPF